MAVTLKENDAAVALASELLEAIRARNSKIKTVRERQHKKIRERQEMARIEVQERTGIDPAKIDWYDNDLSLSRLREGLTKEYVREYKASSRSNGSRVRWMRETNAESTFGQLLRYGIQNFLFDAYQNVPTVYQAIFQSQPSKNRQEWYAPLYGAEVPEDVPAGAHFDDSRILGLDVVVINKKVGRMLSIQRELVDDDQTNQVVQRAQRLGERMRYKEELDGMNAIINANDFSTGVPLNAYTTGIGNRPASLANLSQSGLESAAIALRKIKDPLGNFMLVLPDTVLCGPDNEITLYKLLNSQYQPSIPGTPAGTTSFETQQGTTGWTLTANWLQGRYTPVVSVFLAHPLVNQPQAWFLMQAKRGSVFQQRDPLEVIQENPMAGAAFEYDAYRYRVRERYRHAVIEPRFIYEGQGSQ